MDEIVAVPPISSRERAQDPRAGTTQESPDREFEDLDRWADDGGNNLD